MKRVHMVVQGIVQGVGFRCHVVQWASLYRINGWVRNNWDGTVEIDAQGEDEDLKLFTESVRKGPRFSKVEKLTTREVRDLEAYSTFSIEEDY